MQAIPSATLFNVANGTPFTMRGFTDHEHIDEAQLIHMNGRVYDHNLGRFLSVDPFIQEPGNSQSINPYSYIMNNPLFGTDPSGYLAYKEGRCFSLFSCEEPGSRGPFDYPKDCPFCVSTSGSGQSENNGKEKQSQLAVNNTEASEIGAHNAVNEEAHRGATASEALSFMWNSFWDNREYVILGAVTGAADTLTENTGGLVDGEILAEITGVKAGAEILIAGSNGELEGIAVAAVLLIAGKFKTVAPVTKGAGKEIGILRDAAKGKGNFGLGSGSRAEADKLGNAWVGDGARVASDGKTLVSKDGLRIYRPPSAKPNSPHATTGVQANFERKIEVGGRPISNGHLDIVD